MKLPLNTKFLVSDIETLAKISFIKFMNNARVMTNSPRSFFEQIDIILPPEIENWDDLNLKELVDVEGIVCRARKHSTLDTVIITSKGQIRDE